MMIYVSSLVIQSNKINIFSINYSHLLFKSYHRVRTVRRVQKAAFPWIRRPAGNSFELEIVLYKFVEYIEVHPIH